MAKHTKNGTKALNETFSIVSPFEWDEARSKAAISLANGYTTEETAKECSVTTRTVYNWKNHPDFSAEIDRLSLMVDIASRAERLRVAIKMVRKLGYETNKDLLDWLKFAQSETDGVKLDLTKIAAAFRSDDAPLADSRPSGVSPTPEGGEGS